MLRRIFEPKKEEVARGLIRPHNEEPHNMNTSPDIFRVTKLRRIRLSGHVARMEEMRRAYNIFVGEPAGKRPF
jgi:hypothetical protein